MSVMLLKRNVSPIPNPMIAAKMRKNNASRFTWKRLLNSPAAKAMGNITRVEKKVFMAFDRMGSTFLRASAGRMVEAAHSKAVRSASISPIMGAQSIHSLRFKDCHGEINCGVYINKSYIRLGKYVLIDLGCLFMKPRERAIRALDLEKPDRVPMFELEFQYPEEIVGEA